MSRETIIRNLFDKNSYGLEIGPSYNPIAPRHMGYHVDILDHASTAELRAKYAHEPNVDVSLIEDVDFVWSGKSLSDTVGATAKYDYVVASHVIEHTPDILGFLIQCSALLKPEGRLVLAVPDMRRCFDAFRPLSSLGAVLQAHAEGRTRHSAATACDHVAYMAAMDSRGSWGKGEKGKLETIHTLDFAERIFDRSLQNPDYHDFHAWVFTPSSFRLLTRDLALLGKIDLREIAFMPTDGFEFLSVLGKRGEEQSFHRSELLRQIRLELIEHPIPEDYMPLMAQQDH